MTNLEIILTGVVTCLLSLSFAQNIHIKEVTLLVKKWEKISDEQNELLDKSHVNFMTAIGMCEEMRGLFYEVISRQTKEKESDPQK